MIPGNPLSRPHLVCIIFVLSATMLAYEILLTRAASVLLTSQFVFLILGVSLLGISAGAIAEYALAAREEKQTQLIPGLWLNWTAIVLLVALTLIVTLGATSGVLVISLATMAPFAMAGFAFSRLFRLFVSLSGSLYAADLLGAASGALLVPILLPNGGPVLAVSILAFVLAVTGFISVAVQRRRAPALVSFALLLAVAAPAYLELAYGLLRPIPVGRNPDKDLYRLTHMSHTKPEIIESRWSTFGRTDLVRFPEDSTAMSIFIDGAAGANMLKFAGDFSDTSASFAAATHQFGGLIPLLTLDANQKDNALIVGPGGGRDVLLALRAAFKRIDAVEINPQMVAIVQDYSDYNGGLYSGHPNVDITVAEGRNFLRHSSKLYDSIMLFMPITKSSRSQNAFALSENFLFTTEAFEDYYEHLTDEGSLLIMAHGMPEIVRMMTTAAAALQGTGLSREEAMSRIYVLGSQMMPLFGLQKLPVRGKRSEVLHAAAHYSIFECGLSYIPDVKQELTTVPISRTIDTQVPMMNPFFIDLATGEASIDQIARTTGLNLLPTTDDRPFFFQYAFELPQVIQVVLWLAAASLAMVVLWPAVRFRTVQSPPEAGTFIWRLPLFFVAIGAGYIIIEVSLFQKLLFYLGDPARSMAILLAALLLGSGIGSFVSRTGSIRFALAGGIGTAGMSVLTLILLPLIFSALQEESYLAKQATSAGLLVLQGVPMGVMFPVGLREAARRLGRTGVPWMWAVNGSASVVGSALAIALAMSSGYKWSLLFGAACYLIAAAVFYQPRYALKQAYGA